VRANYNNNKKKEEGGKERGERIRKNKGGEGRIRKEIVGGLKWREYINFVE